LATRQKIIRWFNIHEDEVGLFLWTVALLFLVRSAGILLNNYAETAFLKRYGVEYMPIVNMVNAVATFFVMGAMAGFMTRMPGARLFSRLFVFCGLSVAMIRAAIPYGIDLIYPVLFMLKSQYEVLLALLFWNLANDLFNTRQSKRLFPLITAGGVVGQILGSFSTPFIANRLQLDNLLWVYVVTAFAGGWTVLAMGRRYPTLLFQQKKDREDKKRTSMIEEFKTLLPLIRSSILFKLLIVLTFMPNVVIPIMNYQFNYAVNDQFATESGMIEFFGYFRGVLNIVSLIILMFVGKLYDRFGLAVALMFHPFNYILVFLTFLFRFDAWSAMYARMSSNILRTTINIPATAVVTGLFPDQYRAMVRPFLRGTIVRIGLFLGSGLILLSENLFHPRYLSLVAMPFVLAWVVAPFVLKRRYAAILLDLIAEKPKNFHSMDPDKLSQVLRDKQVQQILLDKFLEESGESRLWYGKLLQSVDFPDLDRHLSVAIEKEEDPSIKIKLIALLSNQAGPEVVKLFGDSVENAEPEVVEAMIDAGNRMSPELFAPMNRSIVNSTLPHTVRGHAVGALYTVAPELWDSVIKDWLGSNRMELRKAGIIAAGVSRDSRFVRQITPFLNSEDSGMLLLALNSLDAMKAKNLNSLLALHLTDEDPEIRYAVLTLFTIEDEKTLKKAVLLLGDKSDTVADLAREKIRNAPYENSLRLVKSLSLPQKKIRESLIDLLSDMSIKGRDVYRFVQLQALSCYQLVGQAVGVGKFSGGAVQQLLVVHLKERVWFTLQTTLRVLAAQDDSGRMDKTVKGLFSSDGRRRANSLEALEDLLDKRLFRLLVPLLEGLDDREILSAGKRLFPAKLRILSGNKLIDSLLDSQNWVTLVLAISFIQEFNTGPEITGWVRNMARHENIHVSTEAATLLKRMHRESTIREMEMEKETTILLTDKILYLRNTEIFEGLSINELAAIASVTGEAVFEEKETVFLEGERGDTLFLIVEGDVAVIKDREGRDSIELDSIGAGDYFGEMALFGDDRRSATIQVKKAARFLTLQKEDLQEIVREFPQIALHVCRVLSYRIRHLHSKFLDQTC
jgi:MFS family permease